MAEKLPDLGTVRESLLARLEALRAASAATAEDRVPVELDQSTVGRLSRMDALQHQAMAIAAERKRREEVLRVEAALKRLETGDYGICLACGEEIAPKRLAADPTAATCINCAEGGAR